jgi:hypothetical protein
MQKLNMMNCIVNRMNCFAAVLLIVMAGSCTTSKNTQADSNEKNLTQNTNPRIDLPDSMYRVIVSFISIGAGTDAQAREKLEQLIQQHQVDFGMPVAKEEIPWGREGEVDVCFKLLGQDKKAKDSFVKKLREAFKENKLVQITENTPALHKARPPFNRE